MEIYKRRINIKIVITALLISILMYPRTIEFIADSIKDVFIAMRLNTRNMRVTKIELDPKKTKVIFMFDDGWKSVYSEGYTVLDQYGYKASVPIIPSLIKEKEYMSYSELSKLYLEGWDLLNHTYSHEGDKYNDPDDLISDFNRARQFMKNRYIGENSNMAVMPYGQINPYLIKELREEGFQGVRTSDNIIILDKEKIDYLAINTINLLTHMSVDEVEIMLINNTSYSDTFIIILHKISELDDGYNMCYSPDKFEQIVRFINEHKDKFQVITYSQLFKR